MPSKPISENYLYKGLITHIFKCVSTFLAYLLKTTGNKCGIAKNLLISLSLG